MHIGGMSSGAYQVWAVKFDLIAGPKDNCDGRFFFADTQMPPFMCYVFRGDCSNYQAAHLFGGGGIIAELDALERPNPLSVSGWGDCVLPV